MRLEHLSIEGMHWVLRSLKIDEMIPHEKALHSRMKEAFSLKLPAARLAEFVTIADAFSAVLSELGKNDEFPIEI